MPLRFHWFLPANGDRRDIVADVGSHEEVANLIEEYASLGITEFIMSGYPHLEVCGRAARRRRPSARSLRPRQGSARPTTKG